MAARFFDGRQSQAHRVVPEVRDGALLIRSGDKILTTWPLAGVVARPAPDGLVVTFRSGRDPARLEVDDGATLSLLRTAMRRWPRQPTPWLMALAGCLALIGVAGLLIDRLPGLVAPLVPLSWEAPLGTAAQAGLVKQHGRCTEADGQRALDRLVARLAAAGGIGAPVRLVVIRDPEANALALPGNHVVVMSGLIATVQDGDELAGVLAHELGHLAHRDATRQLLRQVALELVVAAAGLNGAGGAAETLLNLSYDRAAEAAADDFAIITLRRAGLRADGLGRFFARLEKSDAPGLRFLSDHPPTAERRQRVMQPPDGAEPLDVTEWGAIRAMCMAA